MAEKRPPLPDDDDGRTIADMDVEGMPWHMQRPEQPASSAEKRPMNKEEVRMYTWAAVRAGFLILLVFAAVYALVIFAIGHAWFG